MKAQEYKPKSQARLRFIRRASKKAEKIAKNLERIVDLSRKHNCEYRHDDAAQIFEYIDQCLAMTKEHLMRKRKEKHEIVEAE